MISHQSHRPIRPLVDVDTRPHRHTPCCCVRSKHTVHVFHTGVVHRDLCGIVGFWEEKVDENKGEIITFQELYHENLQPYTAGQ